MDNSTNFDKKNVLKMAAMYYREGQWDKALDEHGKILALDRNDPDSLAAAGDIYTKKKSVQLAYEFYLKAAANFLIQSRSDDAVLVYQKITRLDLTKLSADARMDMSFFKSYAEIDDILKDKRFEIAIPPLGKLLKLRPKDPMALALLKTLCDQIDQATPSLNRYQALADAFTKHGILEKTWEMMRKMVEMDPQKLTTLADLAHTFHQQGHESEAKKAYLFLAEQTLAREDLTGAAEFAQKAAELKSLEAGYIVGLIHFKKQKWSEAKTEFEKLLRIKVNHQGALTHLGKTFALLGQPEKAKEIFLKALKVDENNFQIQEAWVEFCVQGSDKDVAIPHLTILLEKAEANNHIERTVRFSRMLIELRPDLISARIKLIKALQTHGDIQGAADACRALAMIYEQQGQLTEAARCLETANQLMPAQAGGFSQPVMDNPTQETENPTLGGLSLGESPINEFPIESPEAPITSPSQTDSIPETSVELYPANVVPFPEVTKKTSNETQTQVPEKSQLNGFESQLATADSCIEQGLLKAAMEIYQQILEANPNFTEVRIKLHEVNALYLKKWIETKKGGK